MTASRHVAGIATVWATVVLGVVQPCKAITFTQVSYDEILFQTPAQPGSLSAAVRLGLDGTTLHILLRNTSPDAAASGSSAELSGLAFSLPSGFSISGGSAAAASGSSMVNINAGSKPINKAWGYDFDVGSLGGGALAFASHTYNSRISTIASDGKHSFDNVNKNANGLDYGAISSVETSPPGHEYIKDELEITLNLNVPSGYDLDDLVPAIDAAPMAVMFGSPNAGGVPDAGATAGLMAVALALLGLGRRVWR